MSFCVSGRGCVRVTAYTATASASSAQLKSASGMRTRRQRTRQGVRATGATVALSPACNPARATSDARWERL